jgi:hypothetical protein
MARKIYRAASDGAGYDDQNNNAAYQGFSAREPDCGTVEHY